MSGGNWLSGAVGAGLAGAVGLTVMHEVIRRAIPDAPRMDKLGEQALSKLLKAANIDPPSEPVLHELTLLGDIATNTLFYGLVGRGPHTWLRGALLGGAAGVGAVVLPPVLGLDTAPSSRTQRTVLMTIAYYFTGGLLAAAVSQIRHGNEQQFADGTSSR